MPNDESLWRVIHIARSAESAERARQLLTDESFLARVRPAIRASARSNGLYELIVLESEATEARALLMENGFR